MNKKRKTNDKQERGNWRRKEGRKEGREIQLE